MQEIHTEPASGDQAESRSTRGQRLKVLVVGPVSTDDGGTSGGVATHVSDLARRLQALDHEVRVYADNLSPGEPSLRSWGSLYPPVVSRAIPRTAARLSGGAITLARALLMARGMGMRHVTAAAHALGVRRAVDGWEPDVVHYHHADRRPAFGRMAGLKAPGIITVHSVHSFPPPDDATGAVHRDPASRYLAAADCVIAVSTDVASAIVARLPGVRPRVIPNGIDISAFSASAEERPAAAPSGPLVLFVGWIAVNKGVLDLIEAMSSVRDRVPRAALALVGPSDLSPTELRDAWTGPVDRLIVADPVPQSGIAAWLHAADVLVMPSRVREGGGRVLLEAFAAGTPVVACDVGAVSETLEGGRLGALVPAANAAALSEAIVEALLGSDRTAARTRYAREAAMTYDSALLTERIVTEYRAVIAASSTRQ